MGQLTQFGGKCIIDLKAHHDPGNWQRRGDCGLHQQVDLVSNRHQKDLHTFALTLHHLRAEALGSLTTDLPITADLKVAIQAQHHDCTGVDPRAMVDQRRANCLGVATGHGILETKIRRQHLHCVVQLTATDLE